MGFITANYDDRNKDPGYANYSRSRRESDAFNQSQGVTFQPGAAFSDSFSDWMQYQQQYGGQSDTPAAGTGGTGGGAGGSGTPVSTDPLKQSVMQGLQAAAGGGDTSVSGYHELAGPGGANPALGSRIYPEGQPRLALLPRAY